MTRRYRRTLTEELSRKAGPVADRLRSAVPDMPHANLGYDIKVADCSFDFVACLAAS